MGVLSTCSSSHAVHIEIVDTLETDSFIMALRSFISIHGDVREISSDWGTNLFGATRDFKHAVAENDHERKKDILLYKGCDYQLIK